jgi:glycosyltransferase involved in cell wall biosynthesis
MKLLCVIPSYWPAFQYGGPIFSVHASNKALVKKGVDTTVYTTNVGLERRVPVNREVHVDGVKVYYFPYIKFFEYFGSSGWQFSWQMTKILRKTLNTFDCIIIHSIWNYPVAITAHYCLKYKKPYIIVPHGMLYPYTLAKSARKKWSYYRLVTKGNLQNAAAINYTTMDEAEKCQSFLGLNSKFFIIPNGIDISEFKDLPAKENLKKRYSISRDKKVILFLGRINWKKGLDILTDAYCKLAKERKDVHLLIVGPDEEDYGQKVKKWFRNYGLKYVDNGLKNKDYETDSRITFTGMLTGRDKLEVLSGSDIFVLPSYSENFGMAVIEAMACRVPVIISNKLGIQNEIRQNKAGIITEINTKILQRDIEGLLDNESLGREIAENGNKLVRDHYDIYKVTDEKIEMIREIIGEPS